jgi:hypothetical protein
MATFTVYLHIDDDGRRPDPCDIREMLDTVMAEAVEAGGFEDWRPGDLQAITETAASQLFNCWPRPAVDDDDPQGEALTAGERNRGARL